MVYVLLILIVLLFFTLCEKSIIDLFNTCFIDYKINYIISKLIKKAVSLDKKKTQLLYKKEKMNDTDSKSIDEIITEITKLSESIRRQIYELRKKQIRINSVQLANKHMTRDSLLFGDIKSLLVEMKKINQKIKSI